MKWRQIAVLGLGIFGVFVFAELMERVFGFTNFPIYVRDAADGYRPAPNQSGRFLNKNDWVYNDRGMGVAEPFRPEGMLLVGDSEVEGGITFLTQKDRIGPLLQQDLGTPVWPEGAHNWGLSNELGFINSQPDLFRLRTIAILSNSGDYGPAHHWDDEANHPTHKPLVATFLMLIRKSTHADPLIDDPPPNPESTKIWHDQLHQFLTAYHGRIVFILLPTKLEARNRSYGFNPLLSELAVEHVSNIDVIKIADDPQWSPSFYQNNYHPSAAGNRELAAYVARHLSPPMFPKRIQGR